jgi:hypothetical protein
MAEDTATAKPVTANSQTAALLSFAAAAAFLVLLAALRLIKTSHKRPWSRKAMEDIRWNELTRLW